MKDKIESILKRTLGSESGLLKEAAAEISQLMCDREVRYLKWGFYNNKQIEKALMESGYSTEEIQNAVNKL